MRRIIRRRTRVKEEFDVGKRVAEKLRKNNRLFMYEKQTVREDVKNVTTGFRYMLGIQR